ncbi:MAG: type IV pilin protein [Gemmatimonadales bacterium]
MRGSGAGFTLIEMLIVVVIIGLLAGIALPKLLSTKDRAGVASMKSDLRNLATSQESYWNDYKTYYGGAVPSVSLVYSPTPSVTITITEADDAGWGAQATRLGTAAACALYFGPVSPPSPATAEGVIACQ